MMAKATTKATSFTTLVIGKVEVPVGLFSTRVDKPPKLREFTTAGPNGGVLKAQLVARPAPVDVPTDAPEVPVHSDPLAVDEVAMADAGLTAEQMAAQRAEGDAPEHSDLLALDEPLGELSAAEFQEAQRDPEVKTLLAESLGERLAEPTRPMDPLGPGPGMERDTFEDRVEQTLGMAGARESFDRELEQRGAPLESWAGPSEVDGEYGRELVEDGTGEVVTPDKLRRGVRLEGGRFVDCTAQLAQIEQDTQLEKMEVLGFVDGTQVPRTRVRNALYVGAADASAPRALRIIFEGLKASRRMALVKLTKRSRQTLGVIGAAGRVLILLELVWSEDFREPPERATRIQSAEVSETEVETFRQLVEVMSLPPRAIDELRDDAVALREELFERAMRGEVEDVVDAEVQPSADEVDLMAQLEASLAVVS